MGGIGRSATRLPGDQPTREKIRRTVSRLKSRAADAIDPATDEREFERAQGATDARRRKAQAALKAVVSQGRPPTLEDFEKIQNDMNMDQVELSSVWLELLNSGEIVEKGLVYVLKGPNTPVKSANVGV